MFGRRLIVSIFILLFTAPLAFSQSEALKGVVNNLAFYRQQKDLKYLNNAKFKVDSLIKTKKDSQNLEKSIFRAVVYSSILYTDSLNKLGLPKNELSQITDLVDQISKREQIFRYQVELNFSKRCLSDVYLRIGNADFKEQKYEAALAAFQKAAQYAPRYKRINSYIALTNTRLDRLPDAAKYYNTLLSTDTLETDDVLAASAAYKRMKDTSKALQVVQKARKILSADKALLYEEANIYYNRKDYKGLEPLLSQLLDKNNTNAEMLFMAADCYDHLSKYDQAESMYLQAIQLNNKYYDAIFNLALLYFKAYSKKPQEHQKDLERAIQWLKRAYNISPGNNDCIQMLKWAYLKERNVDELNRLNDKLKN